MSQGTLYIIATPIGNQEDITLRALRILKEVDYILCEDTRETKKILDHHQIVASVISYHQHSDESKINRVISLLQSGKNLALVTDAGTPGISDPGSKLVSLVRQELGELVKIVAVPGASALTAAVSLAGEGFDRFQFFGFLPHKKGRQTMLREIAASHMPVVVYESKHRIIKLLDELVDQEKEADLEFSLTVARELTKIHESLYFGRPQAIKQELASREGNLKGEFVVLISKNNFKKRLKD